MVVVERHRSAMGRTTLSRPIALALADDLISSSASVFDYGCGRGGDVQRLKALGVEAGGWDPVFFADVDRHTADVVNLGYVVNVIEDIDERNAALRNAWNLTRSVLIVAARLTWEARAFQGEEHLDGILTKRSTFQRLYTQEELRRWIDITLNVQSVAAAPGIFYVFRSDEDAQRLLASKYRRQAAAPRIGVSEALFEAHRPELEALMGFVLARGRLPRPNELEAAARLQEHLGSIRQAFAVVRRVTGPQQWESVTVERRRDLLVYLALAAFDGRPRFSALPDELQYDVRDFFGSYKAACAAADKLLFDAGNSETIDAASRTAKVGKLTPEAIYIHVSALGALPPGLRVYEGCARALTGTVEEANVVKLSRRRPKVSYLSYVDFERDPHPTLAVAVVASLAKLKVDFRDYRDSTNPPILHRKDAFVADDHPLREKFARLTEQEERYGLYAEPETIGTRAGWNDALARARVRLQGHRLYRTNP